MKARKSVLFGILTGLLSNLIGLCLYVLIFSNLGFFETLKLAVKLQSLGKLISIGAILNLAVFFYFIRNRKDHYARGVLIATVITAIVVMVNKIWSKNFFIYYLKNSSRKSLSF